MHSLVIVVSCCMALVLASGVGAQQPPPSLEDFLGFPTRNQLSRNGAGTVVAWVELKNGVSNIYSASPSTTPQWVPVKQTSYAKDDAMELELLGFGQSVPPGRGPAPPDVLHFIRKPAEGVNALNLVTGMPATVLFSVTVGVGVPGAAHVPAHAFVDTLSTLLPVPRSVSACFSAPFAPRSPRPASRSVDLGRRCDRSPPPQRHQLGPGRWLQGGLDGAEPGGWRGWRFGRPGRVHRDQSDDGLPRRRAKRPGP